MMVGQMTNFPNGFSFGMSLKGLPIEVTNPGRTFWLYNGTTLEPGCVGGSDGNDGTFYRPFSTLNGASGFCTANAGDVIYVKPGHAETISTATALTLSKAGVAIIGLGTGDLRPKWTLDTVVGATINVTGANISFQNCQFVANFAAITACFTLTTAKFFLADSCSVRDTSAVLNFVKIISTSTTDNAADGLTLTNNEIISANTTAAISLVAVAGNMARSTLAGNYYQALTVDTGAVIPISAGKLMTNALIDRNIFSLVQTTGVTTGILITTNGSTNSGMICRNLVQGLDATSEILVTASSGFIFSQNYYSGAADKSGYLLPAADS